MTNEELQERYDVLFDLYVNHIHEHRMGTGEKCDDCIRLVNTQIDKEIQKRAEANVTVATPR